LKQLRLGFRREDYMYTIQADFQRFRDVNLAELIGATGVYVIWDARAKARPTYIGEGTILERFTKHVNRDAGQFAFPWNGYVAIMAGSTRGVHKNESRVVERLLLDVAANTDRLPAANRSPGCASIVHAFSEKQTLRVAVYGYDPLLPPSEARPFSKAKWITARVVDCNTCEVSHDWYHRRRRAPII
jgi:hypothetical protein